MLHIFYGEPDSDNYIFNPDSFFNNTYEDEWITDPFVSEMIKDVDGSTVVSPRLIDTRSWAQSQLSVSPEASRH